jgi:cytochrome oxidase Cu insertion factor (SCO1/SenC/PrrC family)
MLDKSGVNAIDRDGLVNNMLDKSGPNTINAIANNFGKVINSVTDKDGLVNNMLDKSGVNAVDRDGLVNNMLDKSGVNAVNVANVISRNETIVNSISDETKNKLNSYLK